MRIFSFPGKIFVFGIVVVLIGFFQVPSVRSYGTSFFVTIYAPFGKGVEILTRSFNSVDILIQDKQSLQQKNKNLEAEIRMLQNQQTLSADIRREYEELQAVSGLAPPDGIIARILPSPSSDFFQTFIINKGSQDGVTASMKVTHEKMFIGFVEEVFANRARIRVFSSFRQETPLRLSAQNTVITAMGRGGGVFRIDLPRDFPIEAGDHVVFEGDEPYLAGFIERIQEDKPRAIKLAEGRLPLNLSMISFVLLHP